MMGEIADMMLDGTLCEGCGEYVGAATGYPVRCGACQNEGKPARKSAARKATCPNCGRKVKEVGLAQHIRDAHGRAA